VLFALLHAFIVSFNFLYILRDFYLFNRLQEHIKVKINHLGLVGASRTIQTWQFFMVSNQIVDSPRKFDNVIHPSAFFRSEFGNHAFVWKRPAGEIIIPSMTKVQIVLEKINMRQNVVKNHDIHPVRIIVIVKGNSRPGIDDGLIRIAGIQFVPAFFFQDFHIVNPVIIQGWNHQFGSEFQQIPVGNDIFQAFILKTQTCIQGPLLAPFHYSLSMLVY